MWPSAQVIMGEVSASGTPGSGHASPELAIGHRLCVVGLQGPDGALAGSGWSRAVKGGHWVQGHQKQEGWSEAAEGTAWCMATRSPTCAWLSGCG